MPVKDVPETVSMSANFKRALKFGEVIIWNTVSFFTSNAVKTAF